MPAHKKYFGLPAVKTCEQCGAEFPRPPGYDDFRWNRAIVCSLSCASRKGSALRYANRAPLAERFAARVDKAPGFGPQGDCWRWTGSKSADGYGRMGRGVSTAKAHRLAYEIHTGEHPGPAMVCHSCDTPACVNPAHLFLGDSAINQADMVQKERHKFGEKHHRAKLTEEAVRAIRASAQPDLEVAEEHGVSRGLINQIRNGRIWKRVK